MHMVFSMNGLTPWPLPYGWIHYTIGQIKNPNSQPLCKVAMAHDDQCWSKISIILKPFQSNRMWSKA